MLKSSSLTRRNFIGAASAAFAGLTICRNFAGAEEKIIPAQSFLERFPKNLAPNAKVEFFPVKDARCVLLHIRQIHPSSVAALAGTQYQQGLATMNTVHNQIRTVAPELFASQQISALLVEGLKPEATSDWAQSRQILRENRKSIEQADQVINTAVQNGDRGSVKNLIQARQRMQADLDAYFSNPHAVSLSKATAMMIATAQDKFDFIGTHFGKGGAYADQVDALARDIAMKMQMATELITQAKKIDVADPNAIAQMTAISEQLEKRNAEIQKLQKSLDAMLGDPLLGFTQRENEALDAAESYLKQHPKTVAIGIIFGQDHSFVKGAHQRGFSVIEITPVAALETKK